VPLRDGNDDLYFVPACHNGVNQVGHRKSNLKVALYSNFLCVGHTTPL